MNINAGILIKMKYDVMVHQN